MAVLLLCTLSGTGTFDGRALRDAIQHLIARQPASSGWKASHLEDDGGSEVVVLRGRNLDDAQFLAQAIRACGSGVEVTVWEQADIAPTFNILCP